MYRELIQRAQLLDLPIFALIVFVAVFVVLTVRVLATRDFAEVAAMPLQPDDEARDGR